MTARPRLSPGDWVSAVPLCFYLVLNLHVRWPSLPSALELACGWLIGLALAISIGAIGYGTLLVVLDDLVSWKRSPEQDRWLLRTAVTVLPCVLLTGQIWLDG
jgi:hypothetical protein